MHPDLQEAIDFHRAIVAEAGIRQEHPAADDHEIKVRLTVRLYGRAAAARLFGRVPEDAR